MDKNLERIYQLASETSTKAHTVTAQVLRYMNSDKDAVEKAAGMTKVLAPLGSEMASRILDAVESLRRSDS